MGQGELRVEFDGLLVPGDGLVDLSLLLQRNAQVVAGQGELQLEFDGLFEAGDGLVQLTFLPQCKPQVVVGQGELRVEFDGLLVAGNGLVRLALGLPAATPRLLWAGASFSSSSMAFLKQAIASSNSTFLPQCKPQVVVGQGELRVEFDGSSPCSKAMVLVR